MDLNIDEFEEAYESEDAEFEEERVKHVYECLGHHTKFPRRWSILMKKTS